jgi:hypothetical protein
MTHVATMGAGSCATIAISGFASKFGPNYEMNQKYLADPSKYKLDLKGEMSVSRWYDKILYPVKQELGRTGEYPFDLLMQTIEDHGSLAGKFTVIVLGSGQLVEKNGYWSDRLKHWGFEVMDKTDNSIGSINTIFVRNKNRVK